jgi:hypothetical protein
LALVAVGLVTVNLAALGECRKGYLMLPTYPQSQLLSEILEVELIMLDAVVVATHHLLEDIVVAAEV